MARKDYHCARCGESFKEFPKLRRHSKSHLDTKEIEMLKRGEHPSESKTGEKFRGMNRVIIN